MSKKDSKIRLENGFSLLELIIVTAGLGILSSLAISNGLKNLDYVRIDEAKSLLNSAAADCLQGFRANSDRLDKPIDPSILSTSRLKNTGYVFSKEGNRITDEDYLPNCRNIQITAAQEINRKSRHPDLGLVINENGKLTKVATNSGSETESSATSWAGANTTDEETLIKWIGLEKKIAEGKASCKKDQDNFSKSPGIGMTYTWDNNKQINCTDKPPAFEDPSTCTYKACTKKVWYIDNEICGYSEQEFRDCIDAKTTAACKAEKDKKAAEKPPWTTQTITGDQLPNCTEPVWFVEGSDVGSAEAWQTLICKKKIKAKEDGNWTDAKAPSQIKECVLSNGSPRQFFFCNGEDLKDLGLHTQCIRDKQSNSCNDDIQQKRESGHKGTYTNETQGPPPCGKTFWFCDKKQYTQEEYSNTICANPPCEVENKTLCDLIPESFFCNCKNK